MRNFYKDIVFFFIISSLLLGDIILFSNLINEFFVDSETIIAGVIGFIGALLGGVITYAGVRLQISHRDKELFLSTATERLYTLSLLYDKYLSYNGRAILYSSYKQYMDPEHRTLQTGRLIGEVIETIQQDRKVLMEVMGYSEFKEIINIKDSLYSKITNFGVRIPLTQDKAKEGIAEIQKLYKIISDYRKSITKKYDDYTRH
ncbi:hypothetical protein P9D31_14615 [Bacillus haynesii]|uniref:hypothetical protein n=1 Tax=Bacillus haynesii TaxID=1925021 RepID=UPI002280D90A|nr:hypothetical protein [Bacillus haynesii]MCY8672604.1 hypothetical protein [Bacillus haynesii]MEC1473564.1 hypothetical protein [Bacillus haynesii]MEC1478313.1 hypothetical protein [Bacillus haynesii]MEC1486936.1 hypothetical protein [Bacillus haynesii]MEC1559816.1 hypothetical protein [Bacillus haynesii]